MEGLYHSANMRCYFCRVLSVNVQRMGNEVSWFEPTGHEFLTYASLLSVEGWDRLYRLDFKIGMQGHPDRPVGTFLLKESGR